MPLSEEDLLKQLAEADDNIKHASRRMREVAQELVKAETELIGAKVHKQKLVEQMRVLKLQLPEAESGYEPALAREKEIEEFRKRLPELMKKIS